VSFGIGAGIGGAIDYTPLIGLLPLILFVVAMILGRNVPGFWQGLVWFFAIAAVVFTACVAIIAGSGL